MQRQGSLEKKIYTIVLGVQAATETVVAWKTGEFYDKGQIFEPVIQIAQKEGELSRARLPILILDRGALYASFNMVIKLAVMVYPKNQKQVHTAGCHESWRHCPRFLYILVVIEKTVMGVSTSLY